MIYDVQQLRKDFENVQSKFKGKNIAASSLFLTTDIDPQKQTYNFSVLENDARSPQKPDEIRLNQNDVFVFNQIAVGYVGDINLVNRHSTPEFGRSIFIQSVPYSDIVSIVRAYKLFAGQLKVTINNYIYFEKYDLRDFDVSTHDEQFNQINGILSHFSFLNFKIHQKPVTQPVQPMIAMSGAKKNDFEISLPSSIDPWSFDIMQDPILPFMRINVNRIGILLRGFLIQNGAKFQI